jgi:hypothetical protein
VISLLPSYRETLVSNRTTKDVLQRIAASTSAKPFLQPDEPELLFTGWVLDDRFRISLRVRRANHYLPLVIGRAETTSTGSILLLRYTLFPTIQLLLKLWTILIALGVIVSTIQHKTIYALWIAAGMLFLMYFVVWSNFRMHLANTKETIRRIVS